MSNWHQLDASEVLHRLASDAAAGLDDTEVRRRRVQYGPNELAVRRYKSAWAIWWEQLTSTMVVILIVAAGVSAALGEFKDAAAILAIVFLNALLGFSQEYRAEKAMAALQRLAVPTVKVRRSNHVLEISARDLVPGDIVLLEAGNLVPADSRLLESANLRTQEAALTGESEPVEKSPRALPQPDLPVADRLNMAFMGTAVTYGRGVGVVVQTGMSTELGRIAALMQAVGREQTPLQRRLDQLGRQFAAAALAIVAVIFLLGLMRGERLDLMFMTAVSIAVAAVPEGLPAVVTIALSLGAQRMLKRRALIRRLPAVETLGSVTVICSDKTGTLTENRMTVAVLDIANHEVDLLAVPDARPADLVADNKPAGGEVLLPAPARRTLALLLAGGALCNDAVLAGGNRHTLNPHNENLSVLGDPTEAALVMAASRMGLHKADLERLFPRVAELPFDSERKRMTTVHQIPAEGRKSQENKSQNPIGIWDLGFGSSAEGGLGFPYIAFTKGAVDSLLAVSSTVWTGEQAEPLDAAWRARILAANDRLAHDGMRVLGVAFRPLDVLPRNGADGLVERDLTFVGLLSLIDPVRPNMKAAVESCTSAGIRTVMITGDHPLTARHIAQELGILDGGRIMTGHELDRLATGGLDAHVDEVAVYARVSPEHKFNIVQALQNRGHIVAMTGDGVNDAPALRKADIGIAMGAVGTDVAKEASDMVLLDDRFSTIVAAVEEGRAIFNNIRKFIRYLLTSNSSEIWLMLLAPLTGMPLPLLPLQILWMNLVTDGLPALALGVEPAERDTMHRPPQRPGENILGRAMARDIVWVGLLMGLVALSAGYLYWTGARANWQTLTFTILTLSQMSLALAVRSERDSLFGAGLFSNKPLLAAIAATFVLQLAVLYAPQLQDLFKTRPLSAEELVLALVLSSLPLWAVEWHKWLMRRRAGGTRV